MPPDCEASSKCKPTMSSIRLDRKLNGYKACPPMCLPSGGRSNGFQLLTLDFHEHVSVPYDGPELR